MIPCQNWSRQKVETQIEERTCLVLHEKTHQPGCSTLQTHRRYSKDKKQNATTGCETRKEDCNTSNNDNNLHKYFKLSIILQCDVRLRLKLICRCFVSCGGFLQANLPDFVIFGFVFLGCVVTL